MSTIRWEPEQLEAIRQVGAPVTVSAAAGSGKTAVLAERCGHLVCDAPVAFRCEVDELLVVTFTEAAAAEMRERIRAIFHGRLQNDPLNERLRRQVPLLESAQISTIHGFCRRLIVDHFDLADVDPAAAILNEDEAAALRERVVDALFEQYYRCDDAPGARFRALVDAYGLGHDGVLRRFVLRLARFLDTRPDDDEWLAAQLAAYAARPKEILAALAGPLGRELAVQRGAAARWARFGQDAAPAVAHYGAWIARHAEALREWEESVRSFDLSIYERIRAGVEAYDGALGRRPKARAQTSEETTARKEVLKERRDWLKQQYDRRLRRRFGRFALEEAAADLERVRPHLETLVWLVEQFRAQYAQAKRALDALDFADLERRALAVLGAPAVRRDVRRRFAHVLVDEYQDINPLQDALIGSVSRDDDPAATPNSFVVGDIKQSIYRFRGAEPAVFLRRRGDSEEAERARLILLHKNFRSQRPIIDAVNALFSELMREELGGIGYDEKERLSCAAAAVHHARLVDVHIVERRFDSNERDGDEEAEEDEARHVDVNDPVEWAHVEREAYVIAEDIKAALNTDGEAVKLSEVAVLLRTSVRNADAMARMLTRMGVPAHAEASGALLDATEVRDVRAVLCVLDNQSQDIPLAATLRAPVLGRPMSDDELAEVRMFTPNAPYHAAVRRYARRGEDAQVRERLQGILGRLQTLRRAFREEPLPDAIWRVIEEDGYFAYVGGLPGGSQRRANLLRFHERARQFARFNQQGLGRFVQFLEAMEQSGHELQSPAAGRSGDAVRVMTIHASKGLEFDVVYLADLGREFNLTDGYGRMTFERAAGIGMRVADRDRMIEYPTIWHHMVAVNTEWQTRAEELRVLYVALTRAQRRLVLVGSCLLKDVDRIRRSREVCGGDVDTLTIATARTPLQWVLHALSVQPTGRVAWCEADVADALFRVITHTASDMRGWQLEQPAQQRLRADQVAAARLEPLPISEPLPADSSEVDALLERVRFDYPHLALASLPSVVAASEAKRLYDPQRDPEALVHTDVTQQRDVPRRWQTTDDGARRRGTATHVLLEHLDFAAAGDRGGVDIELRRLAQAGVLSQEDAELVDVEAVAWFVRTPTAAAIRAAASRYRREFMFIAAHAAHDFDATLPPQDESILVRGSVDGILEHDGHLEVIDFKTDRIAPGSLHERVALYRPQMELYASSIEPIFGKPVRRCRLVFLTAKTIVDLDHGARTMRP